MTIKEAANIVRNDGLVPVHALEGKRYVIFIVTDKQGEGIGNNCTYVVDKNAGSGSWIPQSGFPLNDDPNFGVKEYDKEQL